MPLHLAAYQEVPLGRSPIAEVICQVRFPPILRIAAETPHRFQDVVRASYPTFEVVQESVIQGGPIPPPTLMPVYHFTSADGLSLVALSVNFISVATQRYASWGVFRDAVSVATRHLVDLYEPGPAGRIGLRFVNKVTPANTGLHTVGDLVATLNPELRTLFATSLWSAADRVEARATIPHDQATLNMRLVIDPEPFVTLDIDFFELRDAIPLDGLMERLDTYHNALYSVFRWSLAEGAIRLFAPG